MGRIIRGQRKGAGSIFTSNTSKRKGSAKHRQQVSVVTASRTGDGIAGFFLMRCERQRETLISSRSREGRGPWARFSRLDRASRTAVLGPPNALR